MNVFRFTEHRDKRRRAEELRQVDFDLNSPDVQAAITAGAEHFEKEAMSMNLLHLHRKDGRALAEVILSCGAFQILEQFDHFVRFAVRFMALEHSRGRSWVTNLTIDEHLSDYPQAYQIPAAIIKLDRLQNLTLEGPCRFIDQGFESLSSLTSLTLTDTWMEKPLAFPANLVSLDIKRCTKKCFEFGISSLRTPSPSMLRGETKTFESSLRFIYCSKTYWLSESDLETLLFEAVPRFPNLKTIDVRFNKIESIEAIIERLNAENFEFPAGLKNLKIAGNPFFPKYRCSCPQFSSINKLLDAIPSLTSIGCMDSQLPPETFFRLIINNAGRALLGDLSGFDDKKFAASNASAPIPMSMWPTVLKRHVKKRRFNKDKQQKGLEGVYFVLRRLCGREGFGVGNHHGTSKRL